MTDFPDATLPGDLLNARDCLPPAGELWPTPQPLADKYAGVVGVHAGGEDFPGAALMTLRAAVNSTAPMVRYAGAVDPRLVALSLPEVVSAPRPQDAGRVQAWVSGPGLDASSEEAKESIEWLLRRPEALLLDASALRIVAEDQALVRFLAHRHKSGQSTVLTPHAGEFSALAGALGNSEAAAAAATGQDFDTRRMACAWLANELQCVVLLKGRITIVSDGDAAWGVDAEHSWSATAGSGDVLAGIAGALIAAAAEEHPLLHCVIAAVAVHATAAFRAAQSPEGMAPISATDIAAHIHPTVALTLRLANEGALGN